MSTGPVFIVGAPRSGTTLLQFMLRSHPNISLPSAESHFIVPLARRAEEFAPFTEDSLRRLYETIGQMRQAFVREDLHGIHFDPGALAHGAFAAQRTRFAGAVSYLFECNADGEGKGRWGDKTPYYALHLPLLNLLFPEARFIHIVRDGRDCAVSMLARRFDLKIYNVLDAAQVWSRYVATARRDGYLLGPDRFLEFRYEDLLADPKKTVRGICEFLDEPFSEDVIEFRKPRAQSGKRPKTPLLRQPVQSDNAGKWRSAMNPRQVYVFEALAGELLDRYGYERHCSGARMGNVRRSMYEAHKRALQVVDRTLLEKRKRR